jgi:hypothetical protein
MRRLAIRLGIPLLLLLVVAQVALPPFAEHKVAERLTKHGGQADVDLSAFPALRLLWGGGGKLEVAASKLSVDLDPTQSDAFKQLDDFSDVTIDVRDSRAGPLGINRFHVRRVAPRTYNVAISGNGTAGDVARYAGSRFGGGLGQALAGLATSALGGFERPIPFDARMQIVTSSGAPQAQDVEGSVAGLPAGPLAQVVANALLNGV